MPESSNPAPGLIARGYDGKLFKLVPTGSYARSILSICTPEGVELASMIVDENTLFPIWEHIGHLFVFDCVDLDQYKPES